MAMKKQVNIVGNPAILWPLLVAPLEEVRSLVLLSSIPFEPMLVLVVSSAGAPVLGAPVLGLVVL